MPLAFALGLAALVGLLISVVQVATQVQEMTLTFVPKLLAIGIVMLLSLPMIGRSMANFMTLLSSHIVSG
jgi:flagellar biosynthetic protein FliQ